MSDIDYADLGSVPTAELIAVTRSRWGGIEPPTDGAAMAVELAARLEASETELLVQRGMRVVDRLIYEPGAIEEASARHRAGGEAE